MGAALESGKVGIIHYHLTGEDGAVLDSSRGGQPLAYLHGKGGLVPGLERALEGCEAGATLQVNCTPEDGYGEHNGEGPIPVPKREMPNHVPLEVGRQFWAEGSDGKHMPLWIDRVIGGKVYVETNHPLAGKTLNFEVEVVAVRDATQDELTHGHAHGIEGVAHHH